MTKIEQYANQLKNSKSLLAKHLTKDIFKDLANKTTTNSFTLLQAINSGVQNLDSGIGVYAGDEESYQVFASLFDRSMTNIVKAPNIATAIGIIVSMFNWSNDIDIGCIMVFFLLLC